MKSSRTNAFNEGVYAMVFRIEEKLTYAILKRFERLYIDTAQKCKKYGNILKEYQASLKEIRDWNDDILEHEWQAIGSCSLDKLISNVFATISSKKSPTSQLYLKEVYLAVARKLWKNPYIIHDIVQFGRSAIDKRLQQEKKCELEETIRPCIGNTFFAMLPLDDEHIATSPVPKHELINLCETVDVEEHSRGESAPRHHEISLVDITEEHAIVDDALSGKSDLSMTKMTAKEIAEAYTTNEHDGINADDEDEHEDVNADDEDEHEDVTTEDEEEHNENINADDEDEHDENVDADDEYHFDDVIETSDRLDHRSSDDDDVIDIKTVVYEEDNNVLDFDESDEEEANEIINRIEDEHLKTAGAKDNNVKIITVADSKCFTKQAPPKKVNKRNVADSFF